MTLVGVSSGLKMIGFSVLPDWMVWAVPVISGEHVCAFGSKGEGFRRIEQMGVLVCNVRVITRTCTLANGSSNRGLKKRV